MARSRAIPLSLNFVNPPGTAQIRWFNATGCVVHYDDHSEIIVGGLLIGRYTSEQSHLRNFWMVQLSQEPRMRLGKLAWAFNVSEETLRRQRRRAEREGLEALAQEQKKPERISAKQRQRLHELFAEGYGATAAYRSLPKRGRPSLSTVWRERKEWETRQEAERKQQEARRQEEEATKTVVETASSQQALPWEGSAPTGELPPAECAAAPPAPAAAEDPTAVTASGARRAAADAPAESGSCDELWGGTETLAAVAVRSGAWVQHVGAWLLVAMVYRLRLHGVLASFWEKRQGRRLLRLAVDAVIIALAIGQKCVEGVRRLATPSAPLLLRSDGAPSASWVRRVLKQFVAKVGGVEPHLAMGYGYLQQVQAEREGSVALYVDNHLRPYTGKHVVRRGWRMQDKRVRPGATDYWVHDEQGRPILRVDVPQNDSLSQWLRPIAHGLRKWLAVEDPLLLVFDRGGAYPEQLSQLRDESFEFVTYERRPYPLLTPAAFTKTIQLDREEVGVHEQRINLGQGRGRLRRIALKMPDGGQVNLLAYSQESAERLISLITGRWVQENNFKYGKERWGINQLDGRKVKPYDPSEVIPNPARRRLDRNLRLARVREGLARNELARLDPEDRKYQRFEQELADALAEQQELESLRPHTPKHVPLEESELAGELVYHESGYKTLLDTIRIACQNAESELACELAEQLRKPAEAKKALANLFNAPGSLKVGKDKIIVTLLPAGTKSELEAFEVFLKEVSRWELTLPGDQRERRLEFRTQRG